MKNLLLLFCVFFAFDAVAQSADSVYVLKELVVNKKKDVRKNKIETIKYRKNSIHNIKFIPFDYNVDYQLLSRLSGLPEGRIKNVVLYFSENAFFKPNKLEKKTFKKKPQKYEIIFYRSINNKLQLIDFENFDASEFVVTYSKKDVKKTIDLSNYDLFSDEDIYFRLKAVDQCEKCLVMRPVVDFMFVISEDGSQKKKGELWSLKFDVTVEVYR